MGFESLTSVAEILHLTGGLKGLGCDAVHVGLDTSARSRLKVSSTACSTRSLAATQCRTYARSWPPKLILTTTTP